MAKVLNSESRRAVRRETVRVLIGEGVIGRRQGRSILAEANVRDNFGSLLSDLRGYLMVLRDDEGKPVRHRRHGYVLSRMDPGVQFPGQGVRFHVGVRPITLFQVCGIGDPGGGKTVMTDKVREYFGDDDFSADRLLNDPELDGLREFIKDNFSRANIPANMQTLVADFSGAHGTAGWDLYFARPVKTQSGREYVATRSPRMVQELPFVKNAGGYLETCKKVSSNVFGDPDAYEAVYRLVNGGDLWTESPDSLALQAPARPPGRERPGSEESITGSARINRGREGQFAGSREPSSEY